MIIICPYDRLDAVMERYRPHRAISIMDNAADMGIDGLTPENHLKIGYSMAEAAGRKASAPHCETGRIEQMIDFARAHDWSTPLLIHCRLGLSRSPAAALIIQCALSPGREESRFAEELRTLSDNVEPSFLMIAQADDLLQRDGRLMAALDVMGDGAGCSAGDILRIPYLPETV